MTPDGRLIKYVTALSPEFGGSIEVEVFPNEMARAVLAQLNSVSQRALYREIAARVLSRKRNRPQRAWAERGVTSEGARSQTRSGDPVKDAARICGMRSPSIPTGRPFGVRNRQLRRARRRRMYQREVIRLKHATGVVCFETPVRYNSSGPYIHSNRTLPGCQAFPGGI